MLSGRRLDLLDPSPLDVEIEDIAHGLARVARWNGQTRGPHVYSVAQHSLLVAQIARLSDPAIGPETELFVLLHDAPEYVIGDIISPFKAVLGDGYKGVEKRLLSAIHLRYGLSPEAPKAIAVLAKSADKAAAYLEATRLAGFAAEEALRFFGRPCAVPHDVDRLMEPWSADEAKSRFLARFEAIEAARTGSTVARPA
jgi:5'-deoxynucleotidase YfbR-like HD superfamily hydrolase